jgi:hypothetical protein
VFDEGTGVTVNLEGVELLVPPPVMLLATKLRSIPLRTKDDKLPKFSLIFHTTKNVSRYKPEAFYVCSV